MMKKDIDTLLKDWNEDSAPTFRETDALKRDVLAQLSSSSSDTVPPKTHITIHKAWLGGGIAAAAAVVILAVITFTRPTAPATMTADQVAELSIGDLTELTKVAKEVNHLFPEGVRWISKVGDKLEIKTGGSLNPSEGDTSQIVIRYVVLQKTGTAWERVHLTDVVTNAGEPVELAGKTTGHIWTHNVGDGIYALDSQLEFAINGSQVTVDFSSGLESGKSQEMKKVNLDGHEYKIYQAVMTI